MGRITAYDQNGRMVADFDKSGYDLMWMRQGYEDEIERLSAENAKLRKQYEAVIADYRSEVAKLRELVRISIEHCNSGTCDECPIQGEDGSCPYADMARELGVDER